MEQTDELIRLAEAYAANAGITHWAVSVRIFGKGDFFAKLMKGGDCKTRTASRVKQWFSDCWDDEVLTWPEDIDRPAKVAV